MVHPWCQDVPRDEAVRAAEDAAASERPPVPDHRDLPERVARLEAVVFGVTESRSADARTDETSQGGLRTERVTLEITHDGKHGPVSAWPFECGDHGKGVRVVPSSEATAEEERLRAEVNDLRASNNSLEDNNEFACKMLAQRVAERDAALARVGELEALLSRAGKNDPSDGDSGAKCTERESSADAEPVADAWGVVRDGEVKMVALRWYRAAVVCSASQSGGTVVPLFRAAPRGWLTAEERKAIDEAANRFDDAGHPARAAALNALLSRNSPPRVRLPEPPFARSNVAFGDWMMCIEAVKKSLAAAGVEVEG